MNVEEKIQHLLSIEDFEIKLSLTDDKLYMNVKKTGVEKMIGRLYAMGDKLVYEKHEKESNIFRATNAWSVPLLIANHVDIIHYKALRDYWVDHETAFLHGKVMRFTNVETKLYIPLPFWSERYISKQESMSKTERLLGISWKNVLGEILDDPAMLAVSKALKTERELGEVFPQNSMLFRAFQLTPFEAVKVAFINSEPDASGRCDGLAFSDSNWRKTDKGISMAQAPLMQCINAALNETYPTHFSVDVMDGDMSRWAEQGVFLYNVSLTVRKGSLGSHFELWEYFSTKTISALNGHQNPIVFVFFGKHGKKYEHLITDARHHKIFVEHPYTAIYAQKRAWNHENFMRTVNQKIHEWKQEPSIMW